MTAPTLPSQSSSIEQYAPLSFHPALIPPPDMLFYSALPDQGPQPDPLVLLPAEYYWHQEQEVHQVAMQHLQYVYIPPAPLPSYYELQYHDHPLRAVLALDTFFEVRQGLGNTSYIAPVDEPAKTYLINFICKIFNQYSLYQNGLQPANTAEVTPVSNISTRAASKPRKRPLKNTRKQPSTPPLGQRTHPTVPTNPCTPAPCPQAFNPTLSTFPTQLNQTSTYYFPSLQNAVRQEMSVAQPSPAPAVFKRPEMPNRMLPKTAASSACTAQCESRAPGQS